MLPIVAFAPRDGATTAGTDIMSNVPAGNGSQFHLVVHHVSPIVKLKY